MKSGDKQAPGVPTSLSLRQRAEAHHQEREDLSQEKLAALSTEDIGTILHELRVHQIEMEMQMQMEKERQRLIEEHDSAKLHYEMAMESYNAPLPNPKLISYDGQVQRWLSVSSHTLVHGGMVCKAWRELSRIGTDAKANAMALLYTCAEGS